jgi:hypothetical protein
VPEMVGAQAIEPWTSPVETPRLDRRVSDSAPIDPRQSSVPIHTERALDLPTAGTKPKAFGACPEKRLCARQLVLGTAMTGIEL